MSFQNLPASIQAAIQQGYLEREFQDSLRAKLAYRDIADRELFPGKIGATLTMTRPALLPAVTTPTGQRTNGDLTDGLTAQTWNVEQYTLAVDQYSGTANVQLTSNAELIASAYLQNAKVLAEQAARSVDMLALNALMNGAMSGNTFVTTTLGSAGPTVAVDDLRGFMSKIVKPSSGTSAVPQPVSSSNKLQVTIGSDTYNVQGFAVDGTNVSSVKSLGGISGTLTCDANVTVSDGTAGQPVIAFNASSVFRPAGQTTTAGLASGTNTLTMQSMLAAKAVLEGNNIPSTGGGSYVAWMSPKQMLGLFQDQEFQFLFRGKPDSSEYRRGAVADLLGIELRTTSMAPSQIVNGVGSVQRAIIAGQGALIEGVYTQHGYDQGAPSVGHVTMVDGIAHITRPSLNKLADVVDQTWTWIGGFVMPTDALTDSTVLPTANNAAFKRIVMLESL